MPPTSETTINHQDLYIAIERLAIAQATIGVAVMRVLNANDHPLRPETAQDLLVRVDEAVTDLLSLTSEFLDGADER